FPVRPASKCDHVNNRRIANIIGLNIAPETLNNAHRVIPQPMADLADTLRTIPLFSGLSREEIAKILGKLEQKSFPAAPTVFSQGDQGDSFYFIQSGAVQVVLESAGGRKETMAVVVPQDWFGEMALLSGEP